MNIFFNIHLLFVKQRKCVKKNSPDNATSQIKGHSEKFSVISTDGSSYTWMRECRSCTGARALFIFSFFLVFSLKKKNWKIFPLNNKKKEKNCKDENCLTPFAIFLLFPALFVFFFFRFYFLPFFVSFSFSIF